VCTGNGGRRRFPGAPGHGLLLRLGGPLQVPGAAGAAARGVPLQGHRSRDGGGRFCAALQGAAPKSVLGRNAACFKPKPTDGTNFYSWAEVASCNYEARASGVRNGMLLGEARRLCPGLRTVDYDFHGYKTTSQCVYDVVSRCGPAAGALSPTPPLRRYTLDVEAVSLDEMFVDLRGLCAQSSFSVADVVRFLRAKIYNATGCRASAGVGRVKVAFRLHSLELDQCRPQQAHSQAGHPESQARRPGSGGAQPGRLVCAAVSRGRAAWCPLVARLSCIQERCLKTVVSGVGPATAEKLRESGVSTCEDLKRLDAGQLKAWFGRKLGQRLYEFARGVDRRQSLQYDDDVDGPKSVSCDVNYGIRFSEVSES